jgi:hypothetical protein
VGFVIFFSTFLIGCIDYKRIPAEGNGRLSDVVIDSCVSKYAFTRCLFALELTHCRFSGFTLIFFILFGAFYAWQIATFLLGIPRLMRMYRFYTHLLNVPNVSACHPAPPPPIPDGVTLRKTYKPSRGQKLFDVSVPFETRIPSPHCHQPPRTTPTTPRPQQNWMRMTSPTGS